MAQSSSATGGDNTSVQAARARARTQRGPVSDLFWSSPPLLLGAGGMLHQAWQELLNRWEIPHLSWGQGDMDLTSPESIEKAIAAVDTRLVINCAAYTNVDQAEQQEQLATAINGTGVGHLARCCKSRSIMLIHYSTDYVFNGNGKRPYLPSDQRNPLGAYGRGKALGEELIEQAGGEYLILRTSWLYAPWGKNFVRTIAGLAKQKRQLKIVDDQRGRPTSAEHLARSSMGLIEKNARGIFHVTDGGECSWFDFAGEIRNQVEPTCEVLPCSTAELGRPAARPAYSVLDLSSTEALLGPMPSWQTALADVIRRLPELSTPTQAAATATT